MKAPENDPAAADADPRIPPQALRRRTDPTRLGFETTEDVEPIQGIVGQDEAVEALRFGLETTAAGQNVFVRGLTGSGRQTLVQRLLEELHPACRPRPDLCYVRNFAHPDRPRLIRLPAGRGRAFRDQLTEFVSFLRERLGPTLEGEEVVAKRRELDRELAEALQRESAPFEAELARDGLALVMVRAGDQARPAILPVVDGEPTPLEALPQMVAEGKLDQARAAELRESAARRAERFEELGRRLHALQEEHRRRVRELLESEARSALRYPLGAIEAAFPSEEVRTFLGEVVEDVLSNLFTPAPGGGAFDDRRYRAHLVLEHRESDPCPVVVETHPSVANLLGTVEVETVGPNAVQSDHLTVRPGSLLRADGGYLILEAEEVLAEPGAWRALMRTLRTGRLSISTQGLFPFVASALKPEPIDVDVKVVLVGDPLVHQRLDALDPDFPHLFKVLADFDSSIERDERAEGLYAGFLARLSREENLRPFHAGAVAALIDHGARIAARSDRLTTRLGRLADIAREASYLAARAGRARVEGGDVEEAVRRGKRRADLPARRFRRLVREGTIRIRTRGQEVGQINGLAVVHSGALTYGFPVRITATIAPGHAGAIDIEREAQLSGAIHTKGFYILGGLLRHLLRACRRPLAFSASIAFEQSYGGIDGDSASCAEICCLLSALTGAPLRQDLAITGAIDQFGGVQAVGAVNEKIEGFFDTCVDAGLTGRQGVIIPAANRRDLMLRPDVAEACTAGRFHVYAVDDVHGALELLAGRPSGGPAPNGRYAPGSLLALALERAEAYYRSAAGPRDTDRNPRTEDEEVAGASEGEGVSPSRGDRADG